MTQCDPVDCAHCWLCSTVASDCADLLAKTLVGDLAQSARRPTTGAMVNSACCGHCQQMPFPVCSCSNTLPLFTAKWAELFPGKLKGKRGVEVGEGATSNSTANDLPGNALHVCPSVRLEGCWDQALSSPTSFCWLQTTTATRVARLLFS